MHLKTRNVNSGFRTLVAMFHTGEYQNEDGAWGRLAGAKAPIVKRPSRNGNVLVVSEPVTVTYTHPRERVLFNAARDANPFFHLYEALWMLAGRNDVAPLAYYNKRMLEFSDDGETLNGAYGYRWRHGPVDGYSEGTDQLKIIIKHLKANPDSRRAVLQMWNVEDDLLKIGTSKDVCCNLSVLFSLRRCTECDGNGTYKGRYTPDDPSSPYVEEPCENHDEPCLDMTVTNRSNDLVWGLLGANYVHFTILQEYMATRLGVEVGLYHHFSNNLHVYCDRPDWKPEDWLEEYEPGCREGYDLANDWKWKYVPLVNNPDVFERELPVITRAFDGTTDEVYTDSGESFLDEVARPALTAFRLHKRELPLKALDVAAKITADDWRIACTNWLKRRVKGG